MSESTIDNIQNSVIRYTQSVVNVRLEGAATLPTLSPAALSSVSPDVSRELKFPFKRNGLPCCEDANTFR